MAPLGKIWPHFTKRSHEAIHKQERAQCNYCSHKLLAANCCEQHLKRCTKFPQKYYSIDIDEDELSEVENNEIRESVKKAIMNQMSQIAQLNYMNQMDMKMIKKQLFILIK
ncbi:13869_t:CDS:1 [Entrophospora sp. SA101]|nr:13869_t:CDS:1 [Entrophospora sp. SA101]